MVVATSSMPSHWSDDNLPPGTTTRGRPGQDSDLLRQITAARSIDRSVVRVLQGETDTIRLLDRRLGAPAVAGKLEAHITHIETSLRYSLRPGNRQQLAAVLAVPDRHARLPAAGGDQAAPGAGPWIRSGPDRRQRPR